MASGSYRYLLNGQSTQVKETWRIDGDVAMQCEVHSLRTAPGVEIEISAQMQKGEVQAFTATWRSEAQAEISTHYQLQGRRVRVGRRAAVGAVAEIIELGSGDASSDPLLFPLMRIFSGPLIAQILQRGGTGSVILPDINDPGDARRLLRPLCTKRDAAVPEADAVLSLDGSELICRRCEYTGDQYGAGSYFWLGEDDLLLRYQWQQSPQQQWDVWLQRD